MALSELALVRERYSDFKVDLVIHPVKRDLALSKNADAVKRAVVNLLFTGMYERYYRPLIGSGLQKYLFEPVSGVTAHLIAQSIRTTILNWEPRARVISVLVQAEPDQNRYSATVTFGVVNLPDVVVLNRVLRRVR
jgi:phage baseplate assembly protein W